MRKSRWFSLSLAAILLVVGVVIAAAFPHTIQYGDTLFSLARRHNTTVADIAATNNIADPDVIYAGQILEIPGDAAAASTSTNVSSASAAYSTGVSSTYTVGPGDTLYSIARNHGTTVGAIAQANDIRNVNYVPVGQVLLIPGDFGYIHALRPQSPYTATLGVQTGTACTRINFLTGKDRFTGSLMDGTYVVSEYNGRGGLASWKAKKGEVDSGWIHDVNITFDAVHVVVSFYPADGSPPYLMKIVNPVTSSGYGWVARNVCSAIEIEYP